MGIQGNGQSVLYLYINPIIRLILPARNDNFPFRKMQKVLHIAAHVLSYVLNPVMAPTLLFFLILFRYTNYTSDFMAWIRWSVMFYIFLFTFILPLIILLVLFKLKIISGVSLNVQKDRNVPQIILCFIYSCITIYLIMELGFRDGLTLAMMGSLTTLCCITIVNRYWKISTHASGLSGVLGIFTYMFIHNPHWRENLPLYLCGLGITLTVCAARLYLKVHSRLQVIAGFALGFISGFLIFLMFSAIKFAEVSNL